MKAKEAPEKIYIFENPILDFTKLSVRQSDSDIEYTRTDALIEKAVWRLKHYLDNGIWIANDVGYREKEAIIEDFEEYLKK